MELEEVKLGGDEVSLGKVILPEAQLPPEVPPLLVHSEAV